MAAARPAARRVRARHPASPLQRRRARPAATRRGGARRAGRRPCPSSSRSIRARVERLRADGLMSRLESAGVRCLDPLGYLDFLGLEIGAARDRDRLRRGAGGGRGARRSLLHAAPQHRAPGHDHPRAPTSCSATIPPPSPASGPAPWSAARRPSRAGTAAPASGWPTSSPRRCAASPRRPPHDRASPTRARSSAAPSTAST